MLTIFPSSAILSERHQHSHSSIPEAVPPGSYQLLLLPRQLRQRPLAFRDRHDSRKPRYLGLAAYFSVFDGRHGGHVELFAARGQESGVMALSKRTG